MASPITIGGVQILAPDQGDTYAWGAALKVALAQVAATCLQTTGGSFPLTADLNLGSSFGIIAPYFKTSTASPAATGLVRAAHSDFLAWRNNANAADLALGPVAGVGGVDDLSWNGVQLTGQPYLEANGNTTSFTNGGTTVAGNWTTVVTDTDSAFVAATGTYSIPANKGGLYLCNIGIRFNTLTANTGAQTGGWVVNASLVDQYVFGTGFNATDQGFRHTALLNMTAGQTIKWQFTNNNGANRTPIVSSTDNRLTIKRLV